MKAIISDVHGNLEALEAVLDDMRAQGVEELYCLGDTVGYGPNPCECLDVLMHCQVMLLGNHEEAVRDKPEDFTPEAAVAARWTQQKLKEVLEEGDDPEERFEFLDSLPQTFEEGDSLFVHGSPRDPTREYIYPHEIGDGVKMWDVFRRFDRCCFVGHTHLPGIFVEAFKFFRPQDIKDVYPLGKGKVLCNVGSVGQPRDGDWRACYVLLDDKKIRFRRVEYNIDATIKKMKQVPELKNFLKWHQR
jgi:diadenosine tetraphosphatase ApaH/serine/threonine PP2A family protein phosphatase